MAARRVWKVQASHRPRTQMAQQMSLILVDPCAQPERAGPDEPRPPGRSIIDDRLISDGRATTLTRRVRRLGADPNQAPTRQHRWSDSGQEVSRPFAAKPDQNMAEHGVAWSTNARALVWSRDCQLDGCAGRLRRAHRRELAMMRFSRRFKQLDAALVEQRTALADQRQEIARLREAIAGQLLPEHSSADATSIVYSADVDGGSVPPAPRLSTRRALFHGGAVAAGAAIAGSIVAPKSAAAADGDNVVIAADNVSTAGNTRIRTGERARSGL